jgi:hypothetical protein
MRACVGRAGMGGSTSALTFQICLGHYNATHLYLGSCLSHLGAGEEFFALPVF